MRIQLSKHPNHLYLLSLAGRLSICSSSMIAAVLVRLYELQPEYSTGSAAAGRCSCKLETSGMNDISQKKVVVCMTYIASVPDSACNQRC